MTSSLQSLLEQQQDNLASLLTLLNDEQRAIVNRQSEDITSLARQKIALLDKIKLVDHQVANHVDTAEITSNETLRAQVKSIRENLAECHIINNLNGDALLRAQRSFHMLNNLIQQSRGKNQMTYNSEGIAQNVRSFGTNLKA